MLHSSKIPIVERVTASRTAPIWRMRTRYGERWSADMLAVADFILTLCTSITANALYNVLFLREEINPSGGFAVGTLAAVMFLLISAATGIYRPDLLVRWWFQIRQTLYNWMFVFAVLFAVSFLLKVGDQLSRGHVLLFFVLGFTALLSLRLIISQSKWLRAVFAAPRRVVLIADHEHLDGALARCNDVYGITIARVFLLRAGDRVQPLGKSTDSELPAIDNLEFEEVDEIFIACNWADHHLIEEIVDWLRCVSAPVYLLPDTTVGPYLRSRLRIHEIGHTVELKGRPISRFGVVAKRSMDFVISSILLVLLSPLFAIVALAIKLESRGPVSFGQWRDGFAGRPFVMYKFRSMKVIEDNERIRQVSKGDSRITRLGRFIRRLSIDELPQLVNVFKGEMSLVGPRPHAVAHSRVFNTVVADYARRHHVKPGMTGLAQIHGWRGETDTKDKLKNRVRLDIMYIENWSIWLDLWILARTVAIVLSRRNAY